MTSIKSAGPGAAKSTSCVHLYAKFLARLRTAQYKIAETVHKSRSQSIVPDKKTHVDWAVERIKKQVQIQILSQLAAANTSAKRCVCFLAARPHETFAECGDDARVALPRRKNSGKNPPTRAAEDLDDLPHLPVHIGANGAGIREF